MFWTKPWCVLHSVIDTGHVARKITAVLVFLLAPPKIEASPVWCDGAYQAPVWLLMDVHNWFQHVNECICSVETLWCCLLFTIYDGCLFLFSSSLFDSCNLWKMWFNAPLRCTVWNGNNGCFLLASIQASIHHQNFWQHKSITLVDWGPEPIDWPSCPHS